MRCETDIVAGQFGQELILYGCFDATNRGAFPLSHSVLAMQCFTSGAKIKIPRCLRIDFSGCPIETMGVQSGVQPTGQFPIAA
jgi:hypothetical protein